MASIAIPIPGALPVPSKKNKFLTFLDAAGHDFKVGLDHLLPIASAVGNGISVVNPVLGGLIQTSVATVISIEQKFAAMGQQSGTGEQKGAQALAILYPSFQSLFAQLGVKVNTTQVGNYIAAIVAALNAFPPIPALPPAPVATAQSVQTAQPVAAQDSATAAEANAVG